MNRFLFSNCRIQLKIYKIHNFYSFLNFFSKKKTSFIYALYFEALDWMIFEFFLIFKINPQ